jgi:flagellar biosynthesis/type III secretory pathway protein FliH
MTIEEAREVLQEQIDKYGQEYDAEGIDALEVAIQALSSWANYSDELWKKAHTRGYGEGYNRGYEDGKMRVRDKNDE